MQIPEIAPLCSFQSRQARMTHMEGFSPAYLQENICCYERMTERVVSQGCFIILHGLINEALLPMKALRTGGSKPYISFWENRQYSTNLLLLFLFFGGGRGYDHEMDDANLRCRSCTLS